MRKYLIYLVWSLGVAISFFLFSYYFVYDFIAGQDPALATLLNSLAIIFFLIMDKLELYYLNARRARADVVENTSLVSRLRNAYYSSYHVTTKSALYLFYAILIGCMIVVAIDPDFPLLGTMNNYFRTVQYGLLMLIAADGFLSQMFQNVQKME